MISTSQTFTIVSAILFATIFLNPDDSQAQMPLPVYLAPPPVVVHRPFFHRTYYAPAVAYPAITPVYYAPQVPVVPMASGPVPTMSAYYVPTVPVVQTYYAPVVPTRRARRFAVPIAPAVIHPVYWSPY